ncbi:ABC-type lipoprotein export system ATPase subunit [Paenibacillus polymyxa]|uniref:TrlF family AAA-like ATPase n=1 Tax=Paenibacillus polymyxa TaxID=1406 RepID=UPI0027951275|nr:AAA family ATPase [Paenibacillus polymyxa]MDQ0049230.1 ABC-type lipoprotein export system ATPase subunit [Paenibacillus polymyxa]
MQFHGAQWWKFDFHTHTPISKDYGKGQNFTELQKRSQREWLLDYMSKEIDCVAITDHNSGGWIDSIKNEVIQMKQENVQGYRDITIFPGVELTVHGNIHLLAVFDPSETSTHVSNLLSRCGYNGTLGDSDECTDKSFNEVVDIIHQMRGLAIPAHVDQIRGLFYEQEGTSLKKCLSSAGLLAMQVCDSTHEKPQIYKDMKLNLTEVSGSDSHHPGTAGQVYTWVKMEKPDLEALRLALHDGEDGIKRSDITSSNPNAVQSRFFIRSIEIKDGAKAGRATPLEVNFSPWLNTIIGGRGSGKSSLIEYMRLPLGKTTGLPKRISDEFKEFSQVRKERGKPGMLTSTTRIRVEMIKDGRNVALTWNDGNITEELMNDMGEWEKTDESSNIDSRFPVRIFSQRHIYSLTEDANHILNIVDQQFDKSAWNEKKEELSKKWMQSRALKRDLISKINAKGNIKTELDDVIAKMRIFEESGYKIILEQYQQTQHINEKLSTDLKKVDELIAKIQAVSDEAPRTIFDNELYKAMDPDSFDVLNRESEEFISMFQQLEGLLNRLRQFKETAEHKINNLFWQDIKKQQEQKYNSFVELLESKGEKNPNAYGQLVVKKRELENKLGETGILEEQLKLQRAESNKIFQELEEHELMLREMRQRFISSWQGTNSHVKIHLKVMGDLANAEVTFRNIIRKPGREFAKDILDRDEDNNPEKGFLLEQIESEDPWTKRKEIIRRLFDADERDNKNFGRFFINHLKTLKMNTPEDIDRLSIWYPEDKLILKLVNTNGREEDIETGSAGQRAAAMLSLMLLLDDSPIIIDQPEEDLDTKRITDLVVTGIRDFKKKQQIIIITHNPNIPVNGASENIIQMNFAGGQIQKQINGALQKTDVREAICDVMEGGKEALDKRYFRISKALE